MFQTDVGPRCGYNNNDSSLEWPAPHAASSQPWRSTKGFHGSLQCPLSPGWIRADESESVFEGVVNKVSNSRTSQGPIRSYKSHPTSTIHWTMWRMKRALRFSKCMVFKVKQKSNLKNVNILYVLLLERKWAQQMVNYYTAKQQKCMKCWAVRCSYVTKNQSYCNLNECVVIVTTTGVKIASHTNDHKK